MGLFGDVLGSVIGVAGDLFGFSKQASAQEDLAQQQFEYNKELQQRNIDWQREQYQNYHQWETEDLRQAGINPILSASHGTSAVSAGQGTSAGGSAPQLSLSKSLEAIANSALSRKEVQLKDYQAETERIKANADMLRAKQDEARTASSIELNESSSLYYKSQSDYIDVKKVLDKAMNEAQIREIDQRIINATNEVIAKIEMYQKQGDAALMSASASQMLAGAQQIIADVAAKNGISQRELNDVLEGKAKAETQEAWKRTDAIAQRMLIERAHNPSAFMGEIGQLSTRPFNLMGEILRNGIGGNLP